MGTTLRAELSEKNPYWIEKHRYYELKHFCLQYPILVTVMDNFDDGENPAVQSMLVTNENNRTATFEYHMDKDIKADIKLSVYYCKECRIITAEW